MVSLGGGDSNIFSREISSSTDKLETECLGQRGTYLEPTVGNIMIDGYLTLSSSCATNGLRLGGLMLLVAGSRKRAILLLQ